MGMTDFFKGIFFSSVIPFLRKGTYFKTGTYPIQTKNPASESVSLKFVEHCDYIRIYDLHSCALPE
jgi:hypothetical protein